MNTLGKTSKTTIYIIEYDKTQIAFAPKAGVAFRTGEPVKLLADGTIDKWTSTDGIVQLMGYAFNEWDGAKTPVPEITVMMRSFLVLNGLTTAAAAAGLAIFDSYNTALVAEDGNSGWNVYAAVAAGPTAVANAWILDPTSSTTDLTRIAIMH